MDYYEPRDSLDDPPFEQGVVSPIQKFFEGAHIFITGASGFMGKVLMEKLLRTCNVAQIVVLIRDKKGVNSEERLATLFDDILFEPLKLAKPGELHKVKVVTGDCSLPGLGLLEEDKASLSDVNIIFHAAASLAMDQHLQLAYFTNVLATKFLLEFAKTLPRLQAFMYISTAYTHAYRDLVEETFYPVVYDEEHINQLCNQLDSAQIGALTPKLIGRWGNAYALTKACAENLISKYGEILPIGVVRPSIVVSVWNEPLQGWINNVYGAVGVIAGTALGLLRVWCADPNMVADLIPVDIAINMTLCATWETATKNTYLKIYNLVSSPKNPITYDILRTANLINGKDQWIESVHCIAVHELTLVKSKTLFPYFTIWHHTIPAFFIDMFLRLVGKTPRLMKVYTKIYNVNQSLMPYCAEKHIAFTSGNVEKMWDSLNPVDKKLFNFDLTQLSWSWFWLKALFGMRVYLVNDPLDTIPQATKQYKWLRIRKVIFDSCIWLFLGSSTYVCLQALVY